MNSERRREPWPLLPSGDSAAPGANAGGGYAVRRLLLAVVGVSLCLAGAAAPAAAQSSGCSAAGAYAAYTYNSCSYGGGSSGSGNGNYYGTSQWLTDIATARARGRGYVSSGSGGGSQSSGQSSTERVLPASGGPRLSANDARPPVNISPEGAAAVLRAALGQGAASEADWQPASYYGAAPPPVPGRVAPAYEGDRRDQRDQVTIAP